MYIVSSHLNIDAFGCTCVFMCACVQKSLDQMFMMVFLTSFGKSPGSKYSSTSGLSPRGHLERQAEFHASTQDEA